jgi:hypothetical protein
MTSNTKWWIKTVIVPIVTSGVLVTLATGIVKTCSHDTAPLASLHAIGTADATVQVYPEKFRRRAHILVKAVARAPLEGGCMRIEVSGVGDKCVSTQVYRNPGDTEDHLEAAVECIRVIEPYISPTITAGAPNGASLGCRPTHGVSVKLAVEFERY